MPHLFENLLEICVMFKVGRHIINYLVTDKLTLSVTVQGFCHHIESNKTLLCEVLADVGPSSWINVFLERHAAQSLLATSEGI